MEGGYNEEHEVSIKSSLEIKKILKKNNYKFKTLKVNPKNFEKKISNYKEYICFNALHGPFGEDGEIQRILKKNKIKFTHSGVISSTNCFNKAITKKIISKHKILTPKYKIFKRNDFNLKNLIEIRKNFKKFVIKPTRSGSSYGVQIIKNEKDFKNLINNIDNFKKEISFHNDILIEEYIVGKELTVSTIEFKKNKIEALSVTEIKFKNTFFDYKAKYSKGYAKHILPAKISKINYSKCLNLALKCHKVLGCKSIARTDFIFNPKNKKIYFLEINTQPGLTALSLLPEQAKYRNISFEKIILGLLKNAN